MSKEKQELERLKIRQKHLISAMNETEQYLLGLERELKELIEYYKKKDWNENKNYSKWLSEIQHILKKIKEKKKAYHEEARATITATPLDFF